MKKIKEGTIAVSLPTIFEKINLECTNSKGKKWTIKATKLLEYIWLTEPV